MSKWNIIVHVTKQKLFQHYTTMIEVLMSKKYNFVAHLVPIGFTRSNLNKKTHIFVTINKTYHSNVILDEVIRIEK